MAPKGEDSWLLKGIFLCFEVVDSRVEDQRKAFTEGQAAIGERVQVLKERLQSNTGGQ